MKVKIMLSLIFFIVMITLNNFLIASSPPAAILKRSAEFPFEQHVNGAYIRRGNVKEMLPIKRESQDPKNNTKKDAPEDNIEEPPQKVH